MPCNHETTLEAKNETNAFRMLHLLVMKYLLHHVFLIKPTPGWAIGSSVMSLSCTVLSWQVGHCELGSVVYPTSCMWTNSICRKMCFKQRMVVRSSARPTESQLLETGHPQRKTNPQCLRGISVASFYLLFFSFCILSLSTDRRASV